MLSYKNSPETKQKGMELLRKIEDLSLLITPPAEPSVWEACANVLNEKNDDALTPYLIELLEWLQDLNWPGALTVLTRLKNFSGEKLKQPFIECFTRAIDMNNDEGMRWIDYLSELLDNYELKMILPCEIVGALQDHYHNPGAWYKD